MWKFRSDNTAIELGFLRPQSCKRTLISFTLSNRGQGQSSRFSLIQSIFRSRTQKRKANTQSIVGMAAERFDDILYNILLKLPVKSVLRCRSVCRACRQLLSDPVFERMHVNQHHQSQEKLLLISGINLLCSLDYFEETQGKAVPRNFPLKVSSSSCFLWVLVMGCYG